MKNIIMMLLGVSITLSAFATQPKIANGGVIGRGTPGKIVVVRPYAYRSYGFGYNPFYAPYFGYNSLYYSPFAYQQQPTKLDLDIQQIENDYHHEIADIRHDKTLSGDERRQKIRDLRHERENSIIDAKKGYYQSGDDNQIQ